MNWKINYSEKAFNDLKAIYEYIAFELCVPNTASEQVNRIMDSIKTLDRMPMMHPVYPEEPWKSKGIRFFPTDNYLVWYLPQEGHKAVNIVRIMYGSRDFSKISV
ncbi:MAG: type II toxin-antitoxin system RelE/ParE family toxin [Bacteroidales bacterium]|nr:type II toxin-antitoxin system RelE/ParE family toxin [Bacteroidales bacterium]